MLISVAWKYHTLFELNVLEFIYSLLAAVFYSLGSMWLQL